MKKCFVLAFLVIASASVARAEILVNLNFASAQDRAKVTTVSTGNGWYGNNPSPNIALYQLAGAATTQTYNMDLATANRFTATQSGIDITFSHFYDFKKDAFLNPMDGGTLFLGKVINAGTNNISWTQITSYVSGQNYDGSVPQLANLNGFYGTAGSSGSPLSSTFTAATDVGSEYVFRFQGGLLGSGDYWASPAWNINSVQVNAVPEPGTLILGGVSMLLAGGGYGVRRWRGRKVAEKAEEKSETV